MTDNAQNQDRLVNKVQLRGRFFLTMNIRAVTGLHIGGSDTALDIGGIDNIVIRDPLTDRPYIPGSSLRGKMRSLWEKVVDADQNMAIQRGSVYVHGHPNGWTDKPNKAEQAQFVADFENDRVCRIFGMTGDWPVPNPTRLIVQDCFLSNASVEALERADTDQPYTETKWEAVIDRVTSAAVPRQLERVPAGSVFKDARLIYSIYGTHTTEESDVDWFFSDIVTMLKLVEDDYLGGSGSRGSGRVCFENIRFTIRLATNYLDDPAYDEQIGDLSAFIKSIPDIRESDTVRQLRSQG